MLSSFPFQLPFSRGKGREGEEERGGGRREEKKEKGGGGEEEKGKRREGGGEERERKEGKKIRARGKQRIKLTSATLQECCLVQVGATNNQT